MEREGPLSVIKALLAGPAGNTIVIGLTVANLDRLAAGQPIAFASAELGLPRRFEVLIAGGPTTEAIEAELRPHLWAPAMSMTATAGLFSILTEHPRTGEVIIVLGVAGAAAAALRGGAVAEVPPPKRGHLPGFRLLAGADTDGLVARITAGVPVREFVDRRGGRTD